MFEFFIQHQLSCLLLVVAVLFIGACAAHYKIHPGALNATDSAAYDTLLIAEAAIDQARAENQTHPLSAGAKDALNILVDSYNVSRSDCDKHTVGTVLPATHTKSDGSDGCTQCSKKKGGKTMKANLILEFVDLAISLIQTHLDGHEAEQTLMDILHKAVQAY